MIWYEPKLHNQSTKQVTAGRKSNQMIKRYTKGKNKYLLCFLPARRALCYACQRTRSNQSSQVQNQIIPPIPSTTLLTLKMTGKKVTTQNQGTKHKEFCE
jgi:hypothetical protein